MNDHRPLLLTAGEPAGIGPDLCVSIADPNAVVIGDPEVLRDRAKALGVTVDIREVDSDNVGAAESGVLRVLPFRFPRPVQAGRLEPGNARTLLDGLRFAVDACLDGRFSGVVTAPLHKGVINDAGIPFSGHTEFLAEACGVDMPVMLLVADQLRVALATTHLPLSKVPDAITTERLMSVLTVLHTGLKERFRLATPAIVVCGLNPHAGESGHLGHEDDAVIRPVVDKLRDDGFDIRGPLPADTVFTPAGGHYDAALAMYHDQGLPVLKYAGFGNAVNVTLGLPIVRTSVDHGTALDIAGTGHADTGSLKAAIALARELA